MNKDIIEKMIGLDIHFLTSKGDTKTISYSDLKNIDNSELNIEKVSRACYLDYLQHYIFNLHMECDGYVCKYSDGSIIKSGKKGVLFPQIADVNIIVPDKVVEVTFADGTKEKSVCRESDIFSLESAISICISKKIMGGSSAYNNAIKRGMKVYEKKLEFEKHQKEEQERIEKKRAKRLAYKERRATKRREEQIAIQTEAYLRAMKAMNDSENVVVNEENN